MHAIAMLGQAVDALITLDADSMSDDEIGGMLVSFRRLEARLVAAKAKVTSVLDMRKAYRRDGSRTAAAWLAYQTNCSPTAARAQTRLARRLRQMPMTQHALAEGQIDVHHAELLGRLSESKRPLVAEAFPDAEETLVRHARTMGYNQFVAAVLAWKARVDDDQPDDQVTRGHAARRLRVSRIRHGDYRLEGQLDDLAGVEVVTELRRIERTLVDEDWAAARAVHGDSAGPEHLSRTAAQRLADALREMAGRSAGAPIGLPLRSARTDSHQVSPHGGAPVIPVLGEEQDPGTIQDAVVDGQAEPVRGEVAVSGWSSFLAGTLRRAGPLRDRLSAPAGRRRPRRRDQQMVRPGARD